MKKDIKSIELRNLQLEDYKQLKVSMIEAYPNMLESYWRVEQIEKLLTIFPEGQLVVLADGIVVGAALSLIVNEKNAYKTHNYKEITGNYTFSTHNYKRRCLVWY